MDDSVEPDCCCRETVVRLNLTVLFWETLWSIPDSIAVGNWIVLNLTVLLWGNSVVGVKSDCIDVENSGVLT